MYKRQSTTYALQQILRKIEECYKVYLTPTGFGAIFLGVLSVVKPDDEILVTDSVYSPSRLLTETYLKKFNIRAIFYNPNDFNDLKSKITKKTKLIFVENPGSNTFEFQDLSKIVALAKKNKISLFIDAMSAFGALPLSSKTIAFDAVAASSNKCLEGVPGVGFILVKNNIIEKAKGNAHSLSLDLYDQWQAMEKNKQWRFTPPTHVLAAFQQAINEHSKEGGVEGRHKRYSNNCKIICDGMKEIGFKQLLSNELQAPIIITFMQPQNTNFNFEEFYDALSNKDFLIYPGKLTVADTFRIGCIGHLNEKDMKDAIIAVENTLKDLNIKLS